MKCIIHLPEITLAGGYKTYIASFSCTFSNWYHIVIRQFPEMLSCEKYNIKRS